MASSFSSWRVIVSVHSPFWRVFEKNGFPHCKIHVTLQCIVVSAGLDINVCPIPVKTDVGQVDLVLRLSDGTSKKIWDSQTCRYDGKIYFHWYKILVCCVKEPFDLQFDHAYCYLPVILSFSCFSRFTLFSFTPLFWFLCAMGTTFSSIYNFPHTRLVDHNCLERGCTA